MSKKVATQIHCRWCDQPVCVEDYRYSTMKMMMIGPFPTDEMVDAAKAHECPNPIQWPKVEAF